VNIIVLIHVMMCGTGKCRDVSFLYSRRHCISVFVKSVCIRLCNI